jgi:HSP20 family protein
MARTTEMDRDRTMAPAERQVPPRTTGSRVSSPRCDIVETDKAFVLFADMPGVLSEGLEVIAERGDLVIRGRVEPRSEQSTYQEFEFTDYFRAFRLTEDLEPDGINATLRDGVLRVEIPKSARLQPRKITVRAE